jgi:hypothetical protein
MLIVQIGQVEENWDDEEHVVELVEGVNIIKGEGNIKVVIYRFEGDQKVLIFKTWEVEQNIMTPK